VKDISLLYLVHAQEFKQEITKGHTCLSNFDCGAVYRATHTWPLAASGRTTML